MTTKNFYGYRLLQFMIFSLKLPQPAGVGV